MGSKVRLWCGLIALTLLGMPAANASETIDEQLRQPVNREAINQQQDVADQLLRLGDRQASQSDYESAIKAWDRAAELYYAIGDMTSMEQVYANIGNAYAQLGDYSSAETAVRRQLAIARDNQNFTTQIFAWNTLGTLQLQRGSITSAAQAYEEALRVASSINNHEGIGLSLNNLGLIAASQGNYGVAIDYYEEAGDYRIRSRNLVGRANTSNNLGDAYFASGQPIQAVGAYRLGLHYGQETGDVTTQLKAIDGLIDVYSDRSDWSQVKEYLDERIALTLNSDSDWRRLITFKRLGEFYEATGDLVSAGEQYRRAYALAQSLENTNLEIELFNRLLSVQAGQGSR